MKKVEEHFIDHAYYTPHHAVIKETSTSTKLRVVFDASMKTTNGTPLNDLFYCGSSSSTRINFNFNAVLYETFCYQCWYSITKMYRQILMHSNYTRFQRIFWRNSPAEQLSIYKLLIVAFGTSSAPYLATRCIKQICLLNTLHQRIKWKIVKNDLKIGGFVSIKEKDLPPSNWRMGRISEIHPGKDHLIKLVDVPTNK